MQCLTLEKSICVLIWCFADYSWRRQYYRLQVHTSTSALLVDAKLSSPATTEWKPSKPKSNVQVFLKQKLPEEANKRELHHYLAHRFGLEIKGCDLIYLHNSIQLVKHFSCIAYAQTWVYTRYKHIQYWDILLILRQKAFSATQLRSIIYQWLPPVISFHHIVYYMPHSLAINSSDNYSPLTSLLKMMMAIATQNVFAYMSSFKKNTLTTLKKWTIFGFKLFLFSKYVPVWK